MSLADEARTLRERVAARLAELEPLVREYQELQRVADEIGLTPPEPASSTVGGAGGAGRRVPAAAQPRISSRVGLRRAVGNNVVDRAG